MIWVAAFHASDAHAVPLQK